MAVGRALVGLAIGLVVLACGGGPAGGKQASATLGSPGTVLAGTTWTVAQIARTDTLAGARPTMAFGTDGLVGGTDGCNQYGGTFRTDGGSITIGGLRSTLIGCEAVRAAQAQAFSDALAGASTWQIGVDGALSLRGQGDLLARPLQAVLSPSAGARTDLAGSSWVLRDLPGVALVTDAPSIAFAGRAVSGSTGCNAIQGSYVLAGPALTFGPLAATKKACSEAAMSVEAAYLTALGRVTSWSVGDDGRLALDGTSRLMFATTP